MERLTPSRTFLSLPPVLAGRFMFPGHKVGRGFHKPAAPSLLGPTLGPASVQPPLPSHLLSDRLLFPRKHHPIFSMCSVCSEPGSRQHHCASSSSCNCRKLLQADAPFPKALDVPKMFCSHLSGAQAYSPWLTGVEEEGGEGAPVCSAMYHDQ